jgi:prolyl-tRNA synthetase
MQSDMFNRALRFRDDNTTTVDTLDEFKDVLDGQGGFILAHWDGSEETEAYIKEQTKATIRCIPLEQEDEDGVDLVSGKPSTGRVVFGRAF